MRGFRYGVTPRDKVARPTAPAGCAPRSTSHLDAPPFPPLASLARRTPPPLGALRVPQRPAAAAHLPLPLLLRPAADRHIAQSAVSTGTIAHGDRPCCPPYRAPHAPPRPPSALPECLSDLLRPSTCPYPYSSAPQPTAGAPKVPSPRVPSPCRCAQMRVPAAAVGGCTDPHALPSAHHVP